MGMTEEEHTNVSMDGNFNIQVIAAALQQNCGAFLESV